MIPPVKTVIADPDARAAQDPDAKMTEKQAAILRDLCDQLGEPFDAALTEAQADMRIESLKARLDEDRS